MVRTPTLRSELRKTFGSKILNSIIMDLVKQSILQSFETTLPAIEIGILFAIINKVCSVNL